MMKTKKIFLLLALLLMSLGIQAQNAEFETAAEAVKNMKVGWNLGLTLDSHLDVESPYCRFESFWVNPTIMPKFFEMLHKAGINAVRLPVTWFPHMDSSGRVDAKWMKRVHEVVDYIIDEGMYCILNTCRDASNDYSWLWADDSYYEVQERYCGLWSQIATEFKDYDEHLQFSAWNEILERQEIFGGDSYKDRYKVLNQINQDFVNAVRSTGGNNIYRNLIVGPYYNWSVYEGDEIPQHFVDSFQALAVPSDIKPGHISFEVHAYYNTNEPDVDKRLDTTIREMKTYLMSKNVPVIFSEWGPTGDWRISSSKTYEFAKRTMEQTKANNIAVFPCTGPLSEGVFRTLPAFESKEFLEAILKGYYGEDYEAPIPTINDFNVGITYTEEGQHFTLVDDPAIDTSKFKGFLLELQQVEEGQLELFLVSNWEENWEDNKFVIIPITSTSTYIPFPDERLGKEIKSIFLRHAKEGRYQANIKKSVLLGKDDEEFCRIDVWDEKFSSSPKESYYSYTVNEVVDGNIVRTITGEGTPDSEITVPYHRYNLLNGKLYLKDASGGPKGLEYNHYFTLTENNQVETINYEQTDIQDVVFFAEGEDIPGMTLCDNDNMRVRSSNCLAAYVADGSVGFVTLPAGSYRLTAFIHSSYKYPDSYWNFFAGDKEIANLHCTVVNIQELQSEVFTLNEKTTLYIPQCGDDRSGIDLLYITKEKYVEPVTITADNKTMNYGDDVPSLTYKSSGATLSGTPKLSTTATKTSPVGTYPIKVEKGTVTNEVVTYVDGTLTIEKAPLTVGVQNVTINEGDPIPSFTLTYSGFRNGDTESNAFSTKPTATTTATANSNPGTYPITISGGTATNYALNYTQGTLTVVAPSSNSYTYTVNEVVNGNVVRSTTGMDSPNTELSVPYHRYNVLNGKLYLKNASGGSKGLEYNHYFTLTENNQVETINYEQTDVQDVVFLVEGEDIPGMTLCNNDNMRVRSSNSLAAYPANGPVGFVTLPVGSYRLTAFIHSSYKYPDSYWSFLAGDKEIANLHCTVVNIQELQSEIFTLNEKTTLYIPQCGDDRSGIDLLYITKEKYVEPVTITADNKTMNYGDDVPSLTYKSSGATLEGIPKLSTTATSSSPVGTYPIKVEQGTVSNGNVIYVDGTLTIEKAALTVGVQDVTITEGDAIPSFTLTYSGFRNGDTESNAFTTKPTAKTTATSSSTAGTYSITVSGGSAKNYALTYKQGTLTIEPAAGIESVYADCQGNVVIYNVNGQKLSKPRKGINIINGKKVVMK